MIANPVLRCATLQVGDDEEANDGGGERGEEGRGGGAAVGGRGTKLSDRITTTILAGPNLFFLS